MCGFSLGSRVQFFHVIVALSWQGLSDFATSHLLPVPVLCYPVHVPRRLPRSRSVHAHFTRSAPSAERLTTLEC